ncbi:hypothetical protein Strvi_0185 (plasmid) [Streptomyces violaceusniger Tu 4113]|uniref:Uncharacterized protein n=1 Tax=Streptomyces violaceusniger (strain Tu 4113) TaxID=653045 RepID=G2PI07_STRV4|nr:hypothetical protein Strvi_0185 [Streptomyces violaceusniger Tu 4113]
MVQPIGFSDENVWAPAPPVAGAMRIMPLVEEEAREVQERVCPRCTAAGPAEIAVRGRRLERAYRVLRWSCGHEVGITMKGAPVEEDGPELWAPSPAEQKVKGFSGVAGGVFRRPVLGVVARWCGAAGRGIRAWWTALHRWWLRAT